VCKLKRTVKVLSFLSSGVLCVIVADFKPYTRIGAVKS